MKQINYKKLILPNIPYVFFVYLFDKVGQAVRLAPGADISAKILNITKGFSAAFENALPSVYPLDLLVGEDIDLWFRILQKSKAAFINFPLSAYRQHPASLMHNDGRVTKGLVVTHGRNYIRVRQLLSFPQKIKYRRRIADHLFDLGYQLRLMDENPQARATYFQSFIWYPQAGTALAWCKSLLPKSMIPVRRHGNE